MKIATIIIIILSTLLLSCSPALLFNSNYAYHKATYSLAILPCEGNSGISIDSFFTDMFKKDPGITLFVDPIKIREMAKKDDEFSRIVRDLKDSNHPRNANTGNLNNFISKDIFSKLRTKLENCNLVLVPEMWNGTNSDYVQTISETRLYDLETGDLIYSKINSNSSGASFGNPNDFLTFMQIGMIHDDFKKLFINNFIPQQ